MRTVVLSNRPPTIALPRPVGLGLAAPAETLSTRTTTLDTCVCIDAPAEPEAVTSATVALSLGEAHDYEAFCGEVLWPLFHGATSGPALSHDGFRAYEAANALRAALQMPPRERRIRMTRLRDAVDAEGPDAWARNFLERLRAIPVRNEGRSL